MSTNPVQFDFRNPRYEAVVAERIERIRRIREAPQKLPVLKTYYAHNIAAFLSDWGSLQDPRAIAKGRAAFMPLVLFPKQLQLVEWIIERWRKGESGIVVKSRDVGASWISMAVACSLAVLHKNMAIGFGSATELKLDRSNDPDTLFFKGRTFLQNLPTEFSGGFDVQRHSAHMRIFIPETGSSITGEAGDSIGRGGRKAVFFVDEAAHLERPSEVDRSLATATDCRIDMSSVRGQANPFAEKARSGKIPRFDFGWRDDPRKDDDWYAQKCQELDAITVAQEIDCNFTASAEGLLIPSSWVQAAVNAHTKLGIEPSGRRYAGLDIADTGVDKCAIAHRHGILLEHLHSWSGRESDIFKSVVRAFDYCEQYGYDNVVFDATGVGAGARGDSDRINQEREDAGKPAINAQPFHSSGAVWNPDGEPVPNRKNRDMFGNLKSQSWWAVRTRFQQTYRAVVQRMSVDPDEIISLSGDLDELVALQVELGQISYHINPAGRIIIDKTPDGMRSPNLADALMLAFQPQAPAGFFSEGMLAGTARAESKPSQPAYPSPVHRIWAVAGASLIAEPVGLAVVYCALGPLDMPPRCYALDWSITAMREANLEEWVRGVYTRLDELGRICGLLDANAGLFCEPSGLGPAIFGAALKAGYEQGWGLEYVPAGFAKLDMAERAAAASRYMASGMTEIAPAAREKKITFRGFTQNFLTTQVLNFNAASPNQAAELASAFYLAVLLGLDEDPPRK